MSTSLREGALASPSTSQNGEQEGGPVTDGDSPNTSSEFVCRERTESGEICGYEAASKQGLALHKSRTHGVKGEARRSRRKVGSGKPRAARRTRESTAWATPFDENKCMRLLFPTGNVPISLISRAQALAESARELHADAIKQG